MPSLFLSRTLAAAAAVAASALLLAGCAPEQPATLPTTSTSPTPSATGTPAPESEDDAVLAAEDAIDRYLEASVDVYAAGDGDLAPVEKTASGTALSITRDTMNGFLADGSTVNGKLFFEPAEGYATELGASGAEDQRFASVQVTGCQDVSSYSITLADGSAPERPSTRFPVRYSAEWRGVDTGWLVTNLVAEGGSC